jgi:hypothetical protein
VAPRQNQHNYLELPDKNYGTRQNNHSNLEVYPFSFLSCLSIA